MQVKTIVTNGQAGVGGGALKAAKRLDMETCGIVDKNKKPYLDDIKQKISLNVRQSDATLVLFYDYDTSKETNYALKCAEKHKKKNFIATTSDVEPVKRWLSGNPQIEILNVTGAKGSEDPGIQEKAEDFIFNLFS